MPNSVDTTPDFEDVNERAAQTDLLGGTSGAAQSAQEVLSDAETTPELIKRGFRSVNAAVGITQAITRSVTEDDPNFRLEDNEAFLMNGIPQEYRNGFATVNSMEEALMLRQDILQQMEDQRTLSAAGVRGIVATGLAGIIDIDLPLTFVSDGGYLAAKTGKVLNTIGAANTRVGQAIKTGVAAGEAGVVAETGNVIARPTGEWTDIPKAGLGSVVFGAFVGGAVGKQIDELRTNEKGTIGIDPEDAAANKASIDARVDFDESVSDGQIGRIRYDEANPGTRVFDTDDWDETSGISKGQHLSQKAQAFVQSTGLNNAVQQAFPQNPAGRAAKKFYDVLSKSPVKTDFDRLIQSKSPVAQALAYNAFESASGIVRNNKSSAILDNFYTGRIAAPVNTAYGKHFDLFMKENRIPNKYRTGRLNSENIKKFNEAVFEEMQNRRFGTVSNPPPSVKEMADAIDQASAQAVEAYRGMEGEIAVKGAEDLMPESGYFPQLWRGDKFVKAIDDLSKTTGSKASARKLIEQTLADEYLKLHAWTPEQAMKFAKAVTRRMLSQERGIDTNAVRLLQEEGLDFMRQYLIDNGLSAKEADEMIGGLTGLDKNRGKDNRLKERKDIDLRAQIPGTNLRLMDLVDTDIVGAWTKYSRRVGGTSALARNGIHKVDRKTIIDTILDEQTAAGGGDLSRELLNDLFSYFDGGAYAGGVSPWVRRALTTTRLSLLNSNGLTQVAETGVQIAAVGLKNWKKAAGEEVRAALSGTDSEFSKSFRPWAASIDGEHILMRDYLALDEMQANPGMWSEVGKYIDGALVRGSQLQGYVSGLFKIMQMQQNTAIRGMVYRLAEHFNGKKAMTTERLYDIGLTDPKINKAIQESFRDIVEFTPDDVKLNFDKWDPFVRQEFVLAMQRHAGQVVQKSMRGESTAWFSKTEGAVLVQLKTFALTAMQKQLIRNARIQDPAAIAAFTYSLGTAAIVYATRQAISGNTENLTAEKVAKGAFLLNNMSGWLPMWTDPLASMLGMDDLRFNHYGAVGVGGDVMGVPPVLPTVNRIAHIPSSIAKTVTGNASNEDIYALQATPIIGNLYGFSAVFNAMKD